MNNHAELRGVRRKTDNDLFFSRIDCIAGSVHHFCAFRFLQLCLTDAPSAVQLIIPVPGVIVKMKIKEFYCGILDTDRIVFRPKAVSLVCNFVAPVRQSHFEFSTIDFELQHNRLCQ